MTTIIKARLTDLLNILDARQTINIYTDEKTCMFSGIVYEFLTSNDYKQYKNYTVTGLMVDLVNNILISKEGV